MHKWFSSPNVGRCEMRLKGTAREWERWSAILFKAWFWQSECMTHSFGYWARAFSFKFPSPDSLDSDKNKPFIAVDTQLFAIDLIDYNRERRKPHFHFWREDRMPIACVGTSTLCRVLLRRSEGGRHRIEQSSAMQDFNSELVSPSFLFPLKTRLEMLVEKRQAKNESKKNNDDNLEFEVAFLRIGSWRLNGGFTHPLSLSTPLFLPDELRFFTTLCNLFLKKKRFETISIWSNSSGVSWKNFLFFDILAIWYF